SMLHGAEPMAAGPTAAIEVADPLPVAASATADAPAAVDAPAPSLVSSVGTLAYTIARDFQWVGWLPALVGLWYFRAHWCRRPEAWVLVLLCLLLGVALVRMKMVVGYLGERHAQILVLCASFWAAAAVADLGDWLAVRWNRPRLSAALLTAL